MPMLPAASEVFLAHGCLRLCCNHAAFAPLWRDQLGAAWFETSATHAWPAISVEHDRWRLRTAMDAVVAHGYTLSRAEYQQVLGSFSHRSFADAPKLCLDGFDEFARIGQEAFCCLHDPYGDIPLVTAPAQAVVDLPRTSAARRGLRHNDTHIMTTERP